MAITVEFRNVKQHDNGDGKTTIFGRMVAYDDTDPNKTEIDGRDVQFDLNGFLNQYKSNAARLAAVDAIMTEWGQGIKAQGEKTATLAKALVGRKVTIS